MDKLEYIPGDLVFYYIPKTTIKKYVKVYVCSTNNALSLEDMDGHIYDYIGFLYPIPLTPEILEKNGWKKKMYCDWCHYLPIEGNIFYLSKGIGIAGAFSVGVGQDMSYIASIRFVHQLQHILFSLNINHKMEV